MGVGELSFRRLSTDGWIVPAAASHQSIPSVVSPVRKMKRTKWSVGGSDQYMLNHWCVCVCVCVCTRRKGPRITHIRKYRGRDKQRFAAPIIRGLHIIIF